MLDVCFFGAASSRSVVFQPIGRTPAMVVQGARASFLVRAMPFATWLVLRVAACSKIVLRVAHCPTIVLLVASCPTIVLRCRLAQDSVLRVAALSQTRLARVAARAASARRCLAAQFFLPFLPRHPLALCPFDIVTC